MSTSASAGLGVLLKDASTAVIAEVLSITGPGITQPTIDVTHMESTFTETITAGFTNYGEVQIEGNLLPTNATHNNSTGLMADIVAETVQAYTLQYSDSGTTTASFSALVVAFSTAAAVGDKLSFSATLRITTAVTWA